MLEVGSDRDVVTESFEVTDYLRGSVGLDRNNRMGAVERLDHPARSCLGLGGSNAGSQTPCRYLQKELWLIVASSRTEETGEAAVFCPQ